MNKDNFNSFQRQKHLRGRKPRWFRFLASSCFRHEKVIFLLVRMEVFMAAYATTKMSSKGQVVIPEDIREQLHLKEGDQFVVIGQGDAVILKTITPPSMEEFKDLLKAARDSAKKAKLTQADLSNAIKKVRKS